jgi:hypothetical protein
MAHYSGISDAAKCSGSSGQPSGCMNAGELVRCMYVSNVKEWTAHIRCPERLLGWSIVRGRVLQGGAGVKALCGINGRME